MKKMIALSSMFLGVVFLSGCGQQQASQNNPVATSSVGQQSMQGAISQQVSDQTPQSDIKAPTVGADWKNYNDSKNGVTLNYPSDWTFNPNPNGAGQICFGSNKETGIYNPNSSDGVCGITVAVIDKSKLNLEDYKKTLVDHGSTATDIVINGIKATDITNSRRTRYVIIYNSQKGEYISMGFVATDDANQVKAYRDKFDLMVSSLKLN